MNPRSLPLRAAFHAALVCVSLAGCAGTGRFALDADVLRTVSDDPRLYEVLWPGDALEVKFRRTPELDSSVVVRPDGSISLPLAGSLVAAGRTPDELADAIEWKCATEVRSPEVNVNVTGVEGRAVHVGGEVNRGGRFVLAGPTTLLESLLLAGGPLPSAGLDNVLLIRRFDGEVRRVFALDLRRVLDGRSSSNNIPLQPSDIVFVPRSGIANVNVWVDQFLRQNIPFNVAIRPDLGVQ